MPDTTTSLVLPGHLLDTLQALADGCTRQQIAVRLGVSYEAAKERLKTLYGLLGARNGVHAVFIGYQRGLLPVDRAGGAT